MVLAQPQVLLGINAHGYLVFHANDNASTCTLVYIKSLLIHKNIRNEYTVKYLSIITIGPISFLAETCLIKLELLQFLAAFFEMVGRTV